MRGGLTMNEKRPTISYVLELVSGQCKWIGREDVHVYCHHPMFEAMMPWGRTGWQRNPADARYSVICPDAGRDAHHWTTAAEAAATIDAILAKEHRDVA